ncbi:MAG: hydrogenase [Xanthomonadales bacterium]|nr:hydrogenase [Xanthomonadales bacterium]
MSSEASSDSSTVDQFLRSEVRQSVHRDADDLLSAGLGLAGLQAPPAAFADPEKPTTAEARRRAILQNWKGIADLSPLGGYGSTYGGVPSVPGREYSAFALIPGATSPHRVLAQVPDQFDRKARCLVVSPASGSRGVYGGIAVGGAWGLARGCAVVYTDKGAGTGFFDLETGTGVALDGTRATVDQQPLEFVSAGTGPGVAFKHAHSGDNPEADWGRHTLQALQFGLHALDLAFPEQAPFTPENTRIIGIGVSNGGGALLRAAELDQQRWFDAVIAGEPNITPPNGRALLDYALEAAIYQPCAWYAAPKGPQLAFPQAMQAGAERRCRALVERGMLHGDDLAAQSADALARLRQSGWDEDALSQMGVLVAIDVWRAVIATYLQSYARVGPDNPQCGYRFSELGTDGQPKTSSAAVQALWWSDASGVAPTANVAIVDGAAEGDDPTLPGLLCAQALRSADLAMAGPITTSISQTLGNARPLSPRTLIVHGQQDGLIPSRWAAHAYVEAAQANGIRIPTYSVPHAQHFDAFLFLPSVSATQLPLLPYVYQAADRAWASLTQGTPLPPSGVVKNRLREVAGEVIGAEHLGRIGE